MVHGPLWPAHYILMYIFILGPLWLLSYQIIGSAAQIANRWDVTFDPSSVTDLKVGNFQEVMVS